MDNKELVEHLIKNGTLKTERIIRAFGLVDRINFCISEQKANAYKDCALPIYEDQTISQPSTVALMTEMLDAKPGQKILEIGSGSGYQAAILSEIVGDKGMVYTIEIVHKLYEFSKTNLKKYDNVRVIEGDGSLGLKKHALYDRIIVTAGAPVIPKSLEEQLAKGGKLIIPVADLDSYVAGEVYNMKIITKDKSGKISEEDRGAFMFVKLVGKKGWKD